MHPNFRNTQNSNQQPQRQQQNYGYKPMNQDNMNEQQRINQQTQPRSDYANSNNQQQTKQHDHQRNQQSQYQQSGAYQNEQHATNPQYQESGSARNEAQKNDLEKKHPFEVVAYGNSSAFQCSPSETKANFHTVFLESAKKVNPDNPADKKYAWNVKTLLQVTRSELPIIIGVLLGVIPSCEFKGHGETNKWFSIENQGKSFFMRMGEVGKEIKVAPVPITDAFQMGLIALSQYTKNFPNISSETALSTIRIMAKQMVDTGSFPAVKRNTR